jgi:hypothetical protein
VDPRDHTVVFSESQYAGLRRFDLVTLASDGIKPSPEDSTETYRFTWNSPLLISPHDPDVMYLGGNKLFKTTDKGESWEEISPDLTRDETPSEWDIMGLKPSLRPYNALTSVAESPLRQGLIYTGADDGSVYRTLDGGETWESLTDKFGFGDQRRFVTRIHASPSDANTAYISFTGHYHDDFLPYLYKTENAGESWSRITGDLPSEAVINCIVEHPDNPDLLLAGIHNGLMISRDGGKHWIRAGGDLPPVSVNDIKIKNGDLVLGTYGRGVMIMDDVSFLAQLTDEILESKAHLFPIREAEQYYRNNRTPANRAARFAGPNPDFGALITYYLGEAVSQDDASGTEGVSIQILDGSGTVIREISGPDQPGFNRVAWDLRKPQEEKEPEGTEEEGQGERPRRPQMEDVEPGTYTVRVTVHGQVMEQPVTVLPDKRR